jgi:hypothetical protein
LVKELLFESIAEVMEVAQDEEGKFTDVACPMESRDSRTNKARHDWDYEVGFNGAIELLKSGWPEGTIRVRKLVSGVQAQVRQSVMTVNQVTLGHSVAGIAPDVGRFVAGEPESMLMLENVEVDRSIVKVVVNITSSGGVPAEALERRGAIATALVYLLESQGKTVAVDAVNCVEHVTTKKRLRTRFVLKRPEYPLDLDRLTFMLAHPAMLRRVWFAVVESALTKRERKVHNLGDGGFGYGIPIDIKDEDADVYIGRQFVREDHVKVLKGYLRKCGVEMRDE